MIKREIFHHFHSRLQTEILQISLRLTDYKFPIELSSSLNPPCWMDDECEPKNPVSITSSLAFFSLYHIGVCVKWSEELSGWTWQKYFSISFSVIDSMLCMWMMRERRIEWLEAIIFINMKVIIWNFSIGLRYFRVWVHFFLLR